MEKKRESKNKIIHHNKTQNWKHWAGLAAPTTAHQQHMWLQRRLSAERKKPSNEEKAKKQVTSWSLDEVNKLTITLLPDAQLSGLKASCWTTSTLKSYFSLGDLLHCIQHRMWGITIYRQATHLCINRTKVGIRNRSLMSAWFKLKLWSCDDMSPFLLLGYWQQSETWWEKVLKSSYICTDVWKWSQDVLYSIFTSFVIFSTTAHQHFAPFKRWRSF